MVAGVISFSAFNVARGVFADPMRRIMYLETVDSAI